MATVAAENATSIFSANVESIKKVSPILQRTFSVLSGSREHGHTVALDQLRVESIEQRSKDLLQRVA